MEQVFFRCDVKTFWDQRRQGAEPALEQPAQQVSFAHADFPLTLLQSALDTVSNVGVNFSRATVAEYARSEKHGKLDVNDLTPIAVVLPTYAPKQLEDRVCLIFGNITQNTDIDEAV